MGVPWDECEKVAELIGLRTGVNNMVAFKELGLMNLTVIDFESVDKA